MSAVISLLFHHISSGVNLESHFLLSSFYDKLKVVVDEAYFAY
jgi:hypothetical protein